MLRIPSRQFGEVLSRKAEVTIPKRHNTLPGFQIRSPAIRLLYLPIFPNTSKNKTKNPESFRTRGFT